MLRAMRGRSPRLLVLGDLMLDVVVAPARAPERGTDVPGRVHLCQGGSAASTARWLARLGARATLVTAVGRDREGRNLVAALRRDGVRVHASRVDGAPTGRIGVLVDPGGERSFVADRGAADRLRPGDVRRSWFDALDGVHLPAYSLLGDPLGRAGHRAIALARAAGVPLSLDLSSTGPLLARGRRHARALIRDARPDLLFATEAEAEALLGRAPIEGLLAFAPAAIVKRGPAGSLVLVDQAGQRQRIDIAARRVAARDTTGAGDAFAAGDLRVWAAAEERRRPALLRRAALAGQRAAVRQLRAPRAELDMRGSRPG
jgi:sugar/nucleoside kinase (ribokinase family)